MFPVLMPHLAILVLYTRNFQVTKVFCYDEINFSEFIPVTRYPLKSKSCLTLAKSQKPWQAFVGKIFFFRRFEWFVDVLE